MKKIVLIILIGIILSCLLVLIVLFSLTQPSSVTKQPFPTPTLVAAPRHLPTPTLSPSQVFASPTPLTPYEKELQKINLIGLMPVTASGFTIEYLYTSDTFIVTITESPYAENRKQAEAWFANQGIDTTKLTLLWTSHPYVQ